MGAGNVRAVYETWVDLPATPKLVLIWMAMTALDQDEQPTYWGGEIALLKALGRGEVDQDGYVSDHDLRSLRRHVAVLRKAGAIQCLRPGAPGLNAKYALMGLRP